MGLFKKSTNTGGPKGLKILVADDEVDIQTILQRGLEAAGHTVVVASDGEEALEKLKKEKIDLVILDIIMPKLDGIQVLQMIKKSPATRDIPVIMLTGQSSDEDLLKGYMYGADYYIPKPFKIQTVINGIALILKPDPNRPPRYTI